MIKDNQVFNQTHRIDYSEGVKQMEQLAQDLGKIERNLSIIGQTKKAIFICGNAGSGKSTLMLSLTGEQMEAVQHPNFPGTFLLEPKDEALKLLISASHKAKTKFPNVYRDKNDPNIVYVDTPGFFDTEGANTDIINTFSINKFFSRVEEVKIVALIPQSQLSEGRGEQVRNMLSTLYEKFKDTKNLAESITLIITKVDKEMIDPRQILKQIYNDNEKNRKDTEFWLKNFDNLQVVQYLAPKQNFFGFNVLPCTQDILNAIKKTSYVNTLKNLNNCFTGDAASQINAASYSVDQTLQYQLKDLKKIVKTFIKESNASTDDLQNLIGSLEQSYKEINKFKEVGISSEIIRIFNKQLIDNISSLSNDLQQKNRIQNSLEQMKLLIDTYEGVFRDVYTSNQGGDNKKLVTLKIHLYIQDFMRKVKSSAKGQKALKENNMILYEKIKENEKIAKEQYEKLLAEYDKINRRQNEMIQVDYERQIGQLVLQTIFWFTS